jgi:hypothetical protein
MLGEFGIRPVDLRIVEIWLVHPVLRLSGTNRTGTPSKNSNATT